MKTRLSILFFLQFAVWGSYLVSLGQFLGSAGLGADIQWFYAAGGFVALFMPALAGTVADRYIAPQKVLGGCHFIAALFMLAAWAYGYCSEKIQFAPLFTLYTVSAAFYLPTIALANSVTFASLKLKDYQPVKAFPSIRIWGTIGFVVLMWVVNSVWISPGEGVGITLSESSPHAMQRMQYTVWQLFTSAIMGFVTALYTLTLPRLETAGKKAARKFALFSSVRLLADRKLLPFFIFSVLIGVALQINNGYTTPFLTHFRGMAEYAGTFGASNATMLSSLSQISEALWILPVGMILAKAGVKKTILIAILAWVANFVCFALGNTGSGLWLIVIAMIIYGVAFNFFNVAGALYLDKEAPEADKSAAQGLLMMMTKGVGASVGMIAAGAVVNSFCSWEMVDGHRYFMGDWNSVWMIFAAYAAAIAVAFVVFFPAGRK